MSTSTILNMTPRYPYPYPSFELPLPFILTTYPALVQRAGTFEPLQHLPKNKTVVLGLITSKFPELEDLQELKNRVYSAAETMARGDAKSKEEALNRICVSPQCGFASHSEGNLLGQEDMKKKLELVVKLAKSIWDDA